LKSDSANSISIGEYSGNVAPQFQDPIIIRQLSEIRSLLARPDVVHLSNGKDYVVKLDINTSNGLLPVTAKVFGRQGFLKDWYDGQHGSKAKRSYEAAVHLQTHNIGTPAPVAWFDRWENDRLHESYYLCLYEPAVSFRDVLADIFYETKDNADLMAALHVVAPAVREMHDAGFMHGDMGNQNILLPKDADGNWQRPLFIDLNRAHLQSHPLDQKQRAFDISRIIIPGAYLKIFKMIYSNHGDIDKNLDAHERKYRQRIERHRRTRKFRRPLQHLKKTAQARGSRPHYPSFQDIWLWDEKTAQPMITLDRAEKNKYRDLSYVLSTLWQGLRAAPGLFMRYRKLIQKSYTQPVKLSKRIGVALHPVDHYMLHELPLWEALGRPPVFIRFYHHETVTEWMKSVALIEKLHSEGGDIMVALIQDRQAVLAPDQWSNFLETIIPAIAGKVSRIEVTHAFNRVKWGIWSAHQYAQLMQPAFALQQRFPNVQLTGPAGIDFEYLPIIAALNTTPKPHKLSALSHLLYVDRRGAPENRQGKFSTLEKCALLKALAEQSDHCGNEVIVSEVNWPVKYTHIWSPIGCPYETPNWRRLEPGETNETYAYYMLRYLVIALCSGHVQQVFWWRLSAHGYGLVDDLNEFQPRPAFVALKHFLQLLGDATFFAKHEHAEDGYVFEFKNAERTIFMCWCNDNTSTLLPTNEYSYALNYLGEKITAPILSDAPIYLVR